MKQRILNYDEEIIKLRVTESMKKSCYTQTEEMEIEDELVEDILKEMSIPRVLSPLSPSMNENLNVEDTFSSIAKNMSNSFSAVPKIVVIPPTPMKKAIETDFTFDEKQIFNQNVDVVTDYSNLIKSPLRHDKIYTENAKFSRRYKYRPPIIRNDFVKLKQNYLRRLAKKKHILNKEIMKIRNLRRQDNLLKTLCTLKHLKINFTISSDSALVKNDDRDFKYIGNHNNVRKENVLVKKSETYSTEQLNCDCKKCNQSNMLLSNSNGEIHLLGFYSIKSEINTPVGSRMENVSDTKSFDTLKLINSSLNLNNSTPESVLEMLAEMVSKKLNDRKRNVSRRNTISNQSDTFCSETETEIERLFYKSNHDVLERNKMLLETAKKQKQMLNLPATEKYQHFSEGKNCLSFDSNNGLNTGIVNFEEGSEYSVHAEDSLCTNDSIRIENESCFDLPSCPQLLSPINSVKNLEIPKRHVNTSSCENGGTSLATSVEKLSNFVKNKSNDSGCSELHEDESGGRYQENKELQQNCIVHTNKICLDDNLTISSNVYEDDGTNFLSNCCTDMSLHGDKSEETGNIQCRSENFLQLPKTDETINENITEKTNTLLDDNDIKQLSCLVRTNFTENQDDSIGAPTDERSEFESIPNFPDSPVPEDVNVEVKWPIVIPLEKLDKQENTENCRINEKINTFSTEVPNNENFTTAPKKIVRRSKRISEKKRCSELSNSNSNLNESLIKNSENFVDLSSSIHPILDHNLLTKSESQEISKTASENIVSLVEEQVEGFSTIHISKCVDECKETTVATSNTRKRMSKLKSQVLRQIRVKRQMFKTHTNCHVSETDNKSTVKDGKLVTQSNKDIKKICIVQNILIPANSDHAVDLLKTGEREDFEIKEKCDISLGSIQNSSRNNTTVLNIPPNKKKANSNDCNIPNKKKRVGRAKMDCDILSKIIDEMDKDRPEIITKEKKQPLDSKEKVPDSTDEKQWRKGVLVIAENIHNITLRPGEVGDQMINKCKVYNPKCKSTCKYFISIF